MNKTISIIIPALNEEAGIQETIQKIPKIVLEEMGYKVQILVVDNGSSDRTAEKSRQAGAEVVQELKRGYGNAYKKGFTHATGDIIATVDADGTYPVLDIPRLVKIIEEENLDFLTTNRFAMMQKNAMPFKNKLGNKVLALATRSFFGLKIKDPESGMWVFRKSILDKLMIRSNSWPFSHEIKIEACHYAKCRWKEVPINYAMRLGTTNLSAPWKVGLIDLFDIVKKRAIR